MENCNQWHHTGDWPDADMLPLGRLALGERNGRFTPDEQRTVKTLWSIARSPLIMGGELRHLDPATLALLTNREVLAVNQASTSNQSHFVADGTTIWSARPADGRGRCVALFNIDKIVREVAIPLRQLGLGGVQPVRDLWSGQSPRPASGRFVQRIPSHGAEPYRLG